MKLGDLIKQKIFSLLFLPGKRKTKKYIDDYIKNRRIIEISKNGFSIKKNNQDIETEIKWISVNDVSYNKKQITLFFDKEKDITIPLEYHENWFELITQIPNGFPSYNYEAVKSFFEKLKGCNICGLIAIDENNECLVCSCDPWNSELSKEYETKKDYIKEMQFDYFELIDEDEQFEINNKPYSVFKSYNEWIQLVQKEDYQK